MAHAPARLILSRLACLASSRRRLASSTTGGGLRRGERIRTGTRNLPRHRARSLRHSRAQTRESTPPPGETSHHSVTPHRDTRPFPQCPYPPTMPVLNLSKGPPQTPASCAPGVPARSTSKCRKMSQNVALFRPSTRSPLQFTSGESHDLARFPAILAHFRSFPAFGRSRVRQHTAAPPPSPAETCRKLAAAGVCFNGCRLRPPRRTTSLRSRAGRTEKG